MATRKTYNSIDTKDTLLLVERENGNFGGYNMNLLLDSLSPLEVQLLVCTRCKGVMNEACQVGEDQLHVCEGCMDEGDEFQPMKLSRNFVPGLKSKCPLNTRGCMWVGNLLETEEHLEVCKEFVISCSSDCGVILKRSELDTHALECKLLKVECNHCGSNILNKESEAHYDVCPDMDIECPNECSLSLKRRESLDHIEVDCPNTLVSCPFSSFGCKELVKRCELEEHQETKESKHTQLQLNFALTRIAVLEKSDITAKLKKKISEQSVMIETMSQEITSLKREVQHLNHIPIKLEWQITILPDRNYDNRIDNDNTRKQFVVAGYHLSIEIWLYCLRGFQIMFRPLNGWYYDKLKWPFKAEFITRLNSHRNPKDTKEFKSKEIVVDKEDFNSDSNKWFTIAPDFKNPCNMRTLHGVTDIEIYVTFL